MEVTIDNIDSEKFRQDLTKALTTSVIGDVAMKVLDRACSDHKLKESIEGIMRNAMVEHARQIIAENKDFQVKLRSKVETLLTDELIDNLVSKISVDRY